MKIESNINQLTTKTIVLMSLLFTVFYQLFFLRILPRFFVYIVSLGGIHLVSSDLPTNYAVGTMVRFIGFILVVFLIIKLGLSKKITYQWRFQYILISWVMLIYTIFNIEFTSIPMDKVPLTILMLLSCAMVGIYEEIIFRGFLLGIFLEKWGNTRKGIYFSVLYSSILFGVIHLFNLFIKGEAPNEVISQVLYTFFIGTFFAAVYIRCNYCMWWCIFLHSIYDISDEFIKIKYYTKGIEVVSKHIVTESNFDILLNLLLMLPLFIVGLFLLRKLKKDTSL